MKTTSIKQKLEEIDFPVCDITLGDFDYIGEFTAKKNRSPGSELYKTAGCFFRPNYERGLLIYHMVKRFEIKSFFEIGFGRGYGAFCAAKAMSDMGWSDARVYSVDPNVDQAHIENLTKIFPKDWFDHLMLMKGTVTEALQHIPESIDMVYIDGDHRYDAVKHDWESVKDIYTKFVLFDDYNEAETKDIECKKLIDEIPLEKELIISDRRIFFDDRRIPDEEIDYGQVLIKHPDYDISDLVGW